MTLDEAIKHCEEVAEAEEQKYKEWKDDYPHLKKIDSCLECAEEHRQLAEWLRELKDYREAWSQFGETLTELKNYNTYDNPDVDYVCRFLVNYKNVLERQIRNKEVNADED